ncbi:MAG: serine/threonine protein kinase [Myxococcales bacterium]|nr:serine/threonine protein kinase [Myxococcales bacterium]
MGGQAAEQIIAGVVLSERLAVTMYGAIHRAQFSGQRNLRGLVVDTKLLAEDAFRIPLTDPKPLAPVLKLEHPSIVQTVGVESGGSEVVVITRGGGRYVTVQDLITAAKARSKQGGKLSTPVAALIGRSVIEALAAAHKAGVIHGAVHPRSVLIDEDGSVRLGDFVVGRALTTAVAQGADSSLWRGLAGYIAPELVVGEDPTPACDVFAVGAMLFTMLSGEAPPGTLRVTPAVERLVQRALDTDMTRRYRSAEDLLSNLLEAMEDDRWEIAERGELIKEAGLQTTDGNIDDATEDLLASLGSSTVQVTPMRPSMDLRAEQAAARQQTPTGAKGRLDALIADLDESTGVTAIDSPAFDRRSRDPISELIRADPRKKEAIVSATRVPSLDDPDDDSTPLPPPARESDLDMTRDSGSSRRRSSSGGAPRANSHDEAAALAAIGELDVGAKRVSSAAESADAAVRKLEQAADRAEAAVKRAETQPKVVRPIVDPIIIDDLKPPRLKSRVPGIIALLVIAAVGYFGYHQYMLQEERSADAKRKEEAAKKQHDDDERKALDSIPDPGSIVITSNPSQAGVWLRIGRTPTDTMSLQANNSAELGLLLDGYEMTEAQVGGVNWSGANATQKAAIAVTLKKAKSKRVAALPLQPVAMHITTGIVGGGPIHVDSTPPDAEVWLYVGLTGSMNFSALTAGRDYELAVVKDGYLTGHVSIKANDWRDGGDPKLAIDVAKKKSVIERNVDLEPDPSKPGKGK